MVSANREAFGFEYTRHRIALLHRGDVHDSGALCLAQQAYKALLLGNVSRGVMDLVVQVRAVHSEIEHLRRLQSEKARDVVEDPRRRGGGQRENRRPAQRLHGAAERQEGRAEVVPPL